jgi:hypothetical protein
MSVCLVVTLFGGKRVGVDKGSILLLLYKREFRAVMRFFDSCSVLFYGVQYCALAAWL